ncbi:hypothetical protein EST38_g6958 [Candolleomyces aberdarensis]|uniref:Uncharacterized protein n=1 Tax=Candolleomyces aberdarensis TaxID=2316362 RepID=A0A4Q2DGT8_9AGAR|nr:hypothetical protein EST38_g6958 [Candolleomyces aberdarensis]
MDRIVIFTLDLHIFSARPGTHVDDLNLMLPHEERCILSKETGRSIVQVANVTLIIGADAILRPLSFKLTPGSCYYVHETTGAVSTHIRSVAQCGFIWKSASRFLGEDHRARYGVMFFVLAPTPLLSLGLSYMITHFMELYYLKGGKTFSLVDITYEFDVRGVFGVLFFDENLGPAYEWVVDRALDENDMEHGFYGDGVDTCSPFSAWNCTIPQFANGNANDLIGEFHIRSEILVDQAVIEEFNIH